MRPPGFASLLVLTLLVATGRAQAQGFQDVSFSWVRTVGAESCIGTHELARAVEARIGHAIWVATGDAQLSVEGYVRPALPQGFEAMLTTSNADDEIVGRRELRTQSDDCRSLDEPLALVIALTVDPESGFVPLPSIFENTGEEDFAGLLDQPTPEVEELEQEEPAPEPAAPRPPPANLSLQEGPSRPRGFYAAAGLGGGYAPGPTGGVLVGFMGSRTGLRVGAEARFWLPRSDDLGTDNYRLSTGQAAFYGCPVWQKASKRALTGQLCLGIIPGFTIVRSHDGRGTEGSLELELNGRLLFATARRITPFLSVHAGLALYGVTVTEQYPDNSREDLWSVPLARGGATLGIFFPR